MLKQILAKEISRVARAHSKSASMRLTVPERVASELDLDIRDLVEWEIYTEKGKTFARVRKME
jgi:hypothetical protein